MIFREIVRADLPALFAVRVATRENALSRKQLRSLGITEASVLGMLGHSHRGWLCEVQGHIVAFAMGDRRTGEMWVIAVLPDHEGKGIGHRLLGQVEDWLWSCGWSEAWLTTDVDTSLRAYGFYLAHGWFDWEVRDGNRTMKKRNPGGPFQAPPPASRPPVLPPARPSE